MPASISRDLHLCVDAVGCGLNVVRALAQWGDHRRKISMTTPGAMGSILVGFVLTAALGHLSSAEAQENPAAVAARAWRQTNEWQILAEYFQLLGIPNVSRDKPNIRRNAENL